MALYDAYEELSSLHDRLRGFVPSATDSVAGPAVAPFAREIRYHPSAGRRVADLNAHETYAGLSGVTFAIRGEGARGTESVRIRISTGWPSSASRAYPNARAVCTNLYSASYAAQANSYVRIATSLPGYRRGVQYLVQSDRKSENSRPGNFDQNFKLHPNRHPIPCI